MTINKSSSTITDETTESTTDVVTIGRVCNDCTVLHINGDQSSFDMCPETAEDRIAMSEATLASVVRDELPGGHVTSATAGDESETFDCFLCNETQCDTPNILDITKVTHERL